MDKIQGKRILIVEDDGLTGEVIAETISAAGGWPLGPVVSDQEALDMIDYNPGVPDAAIVDLRMNGLTFVVAERLRDLGVPFIFATEDGQEIPEHLGHVPVCDRPCSADGLLDSLDKAMLADERLSAPQAVTLAFVAPDRAID